MLKHAAIVVWFAQSIMLRHWFPERFLGGCKEKTLRVSFPFG